MPRNAKRSYAVVWTNDQTTESGRLEVRRDGLELYGRESRLSIALAELTRAVISRSEPDRLRGLPVLVLTPRCGPRIRIASLEGAGALHELAARLPYAELSAAAAPDGM
jgi:hypothetical protein